MLSEDGKEEHKNETESLNFLGFDQAAETMIKKVKQALADGEGCRVSTFALVNTQTRNDAFLAVFKLTETNLFGCFPGLRCHRCTTSSWKLPYLSSWAKHLRCSDGWYHSTNHPFVLIICICTSFTDLL